MLNTEETSGQDTLQALLTMFVLALQRAIEAQEGSFAWVDTLLYMWTDTCMHTNMYTITRKHIYMCTQCFDCLHYLLPSNM